MIKSIPLSDITEKDLIYFSKFPHSRGIRELQRTKVFSSFKRDCVPKLSDNECYLSIYKLIEQKDEVFLYEKITLVAVDFFVNKNNILYWIDDEKPKSWFKRLFSNDRVQSV